MEFSSSPFLACSAESVSWQLVPGATSQKVVGDEVARARWWVA